MNSILALFKVANSNVDNLEEDSGDPNSVVNDLSIIAEDMNCINALNTSHNKYIQKLTANVFALCISMESYPKEIGTNHEIIDKLNNLTNVNQTNLV